MNDTILSRIITKATSVVALIIVAMIALGSFYMLVVRQQYGIAENQSLYPLSVVALAIISIIVLSIFMFRQKLVNQKHLFFFLFLLLLLYSFYTVLTTHVLPNYDPAVVNDQISAFIKTGKFDWIDYYYYYPINVNIVVLCSAIFSPFKFLITSFGYFPFVHAVGILFWAVTVYFATGFFEKKDYRVKNLAMLFFILITPVMAPYFSSPYTSNYSLGLMVIACYFLYKFLATGKISKYAIFSVFLLLAFLIRGNSLILLVAAVLMLILAAKVKVSIKKGIAVFLVSVVVIVAGNFGMKAVASATGFKPNSSKVEAQPAVGWLLHAFDYKTQGVYSNDNIELIKEAQTKKNTNSVILSEVTGRIKENGFLATLKLFVSKSYTMFSYNSTYISPDLSSPNNYDKVKWRAMLRMSVLVLSLVMFFACNLMSLLGKIKLSIAYYLSSIVFIGFALFYIFIWEVQTSYGIPLLFLLAWLLILGSKELLINYKIEEKI